MEMTTSFVPISMCHNSHFRISKILCHFDVWVEYGTSAILILGALSSYAK